MRPSIISIALGVLATAAQSHSSVSLQPRTPDALQGILDEVNKGGLEALKTKEIEALCESAKKKGGVNGLLGELNIGEALKKGLEQSLTKECRAGERPKPGETPQSNLPPARQSSPSLERQTTSTSRPLQNATPGFASPAVTSRASARQNATRAGTFPEASGSIGLTSNRGLTEPGASQSSFRSGIGPDAGVETPVPTAIPAGCSGPIQEGCPAAFTSTPEASATCVRVNGTCTGISPAAVTAAGLRLDSIGVIGAMCAIICTLIIL